MKAGASRRIALGGGLELHVADLRRSPSGKLTADLSVRQGERQISCARVALNDPAARQEWAAHIAAAHGLDAEDLEAALVARAGETEDATTRDARTSQTDLILELLRAQPNVEFFHDPRGRSFIALDVDGHRVTLSAADAAVQDLLTKLYLAKTGRAPSDSAMSDALRTVQALSRYEGDERFVFLRVARHGGAIIVDLGDRTYRVVEVTASGWQVLGKSPVHFERPNGYGPLPSPELEGTVNELWPLVNIAPSDRLLFLAWMMQAFRPTGPYPILAFRGEQGSAKSSTSRVIKRLIDPHAVALRALTRDLRDLWIHASSAWLLSFDNLSRISHEQSDTLCRLATGGGHATRTLYKDAEETLFEAQRPILANGIDDVVTRADLLQRTLVLTLPTIPECARKPEDELRDALEQGAGRIFGALLELLSGVLRAEGDVRLAAYPRMADFARTGVAVARALGQPDAAFLDAYKANMDAAESIAVDASPVGEALFALLSDDPTWAGSASDLAKELALRGASVKEGRAVRGEVERLRPALRTAGIDVTTRRTSRQRRIAFAPAGGGSPGPDPSARQQLRPDERDSVGSGQRHEDSSVVPSGSERGDGDDDRDDVTTGEGGSSSASNSPLEVFRC